MSQWGAYGFAQRGTTYDKILAHYYRGTTLGKAPVARIRVLLGEGKKALAISSDSPFSVKDSQGAVYQLAAGPYQLGPALKVKVDPAQPAKALPGPLVFLPGATPLKYAGKEYRGQLQVNPGKAAPAAREQRRARAVPLRRRAARGAVRLAARGAQGAGGRRALVRARGAQGRGVRRLRRHAQPGLRRCRGREAVDDGRGRRDGRSGRALRGQGRDHVLLLDLRRTHRVDRGRMGARTSRRRTSSPSPTPTRPPPRTTSGGRSPSPRPSFAPRSRCRASCST